MKLKCLALVGTVVALAACDRGTNNADALRGTNYLANQDGVNIALSFDPANNTVHGQIVNMYNGPYTIDGNKITFGNIATTMMMGPADAMAVEQEYLEFMRGTTTYELGAETLTIRGANGQEIVFEQVDVIPEPVNE